MLTSLLCVLFGLVVIFALVSRKNSRLLYPPGPPPKPFIGNALDIPTDMPWVKYLEWSKRLGSMFPSCTQRLKYLTVSFRRHHPHDSVGQAHCRFKQVGRHNRAHGEAFGYIQQSSLDPSY